VIVSRDRIRAALARALHLSVSHDYDEAVEAVAQALGIEREAVIEAVEQVEEMPAC
jgi:hypothetical protein